jgi:hypothetical protein
MLGFNDLSVVSLNKRKAAGHARRFRRNHAGNATLTHRRNTPRYKMPLARYRTGS